MSKRASNRPSITVNFFMNFLLNISSVLFPLITFPYASRVLGPAGTGAVAMGTSYVSYFTMAAMLGVPVYGVRACASVRDDPVRLSMTVQELLILNLIMGAVAYGAFFLSLILVPSLASEQTMYIICSAAIFLNIIGMNWVFQALEQLTYISMAGMFFKALGLVLLFLLVHSAHDVNLYAAVTVISSFGSGLINFWYLRKLVPFKKRGKWNFRQHFRPMLRFFAMAVASSVYTSLDVVMLGFMKDNTAVGYYNASVKVKTILVTMTTSLGTVLLPRLSFYARHHQMKGFWKLVSKAFSFVLLFSIPCCLFFSIMAKDVILLLSGAEFLPAIPAMIVLMPTILLIGLTNITGMQILVPQNEEKTVLYSVIGGALVDFLLNLALISLLGSTGAAIGTLAAETAVLIIQFARLRRPLRRLSRRIEWGPLLWGMLFASPILLISSSLLNAGPFWRLAVCAILFFGVYGVVLLLRRESILMQLLRKLIAR